MSKPTAFPLDESKLPFEIPKDAVLREKIVKLARKAAAFPTLNPRMLKNPNDRMGSRARFSA